MNNFAIVDVSPLQDKTRFVLTIPDLQPLVVTGGEKAIAIAIAGNTNHTIKEAQRIASDLMETLNHG